MTKRIISILLLSFLLLSFAACTKAEKKKKAETEKVTETAPVTETEAVTTEAEPKIVEPEFVNPLTGLESDKDLSKKRPVSVMVNNIWDSLPQEGISQADILYECLAEGGITRLMAIITDYDSITKIGSVRSARHYYIDFAEGYQCIFVHAGGSPFAYSTLSERGNDHIDGVNGPATLYYTTNTFFRDPERLPYYAAEHTLMIQNGAGLVAAIDMYGFSKEKTADADRPMNFAPFGESVKLKKSATHCRVPMSSYQTVDFEYDAASSKYLRYQYDGEAHIDKTTGKQLAFENVLLIFTETGAIAGDDKARIDIQTTGEGDGVYLTGGTYEVIKWKKEKHDSVMKYYYSDGKELSLNRGKTMINVVPTYQMPYVEYDNEKVK